MQEIAPGLWDWATLHEGIGEPVHSHLVTASGTLIDPRVPDGGLDALPAAPARVVLTNRHHLRHARAFAERFEVPVLCHEAGLHEFAPGDGVRGFAVGEALAEDVRAVEVGAITPEEAGLVISAAGGWLALADVVMRPGGGDRELSYVPDSLLGDDPAAVRRAMTDALARVLAQERWEGLLLAHGDPVPEGRAALSDFVASQRG